MEVMKYNKRKATGLEWLGMGLNSIWGILEFDIGYRKIFANVWRFYFNEAKSIAKQQKEWLDGIAAKAGNGTRNTIVKGKNDDFTRAFAGVTVPMLVTYGKYDIYGPSKMISIKRLLRAKHFEFENAGHLPWILDKEKFERTLLEFYGSSDLLAGGGIPDR